MRHEVVGLNIFPKLRGSKYVNDTYFGTIINIDITYVGLFGYPGKGRDLHHDLKRNVNLEL